MVSLLSIVFMGISGIIAIGVPIATLIYFYKKFHISWQSVVVGALIFFVFSQILEKLLNVYVITINPYTMGWMKNPFVYAAYGAIAAGVFEEFGRYFGFRFLLQKYWKWKGGIAYGIGHGGMEAVLIGLLASVQSIVFALLINSGGFQQMIQATGGGQAAASLQAIQHQLLHTPSYLFLMSGLERVFAFALQLALSLIVLYGVRQGKMVFLLWAIFIHAAVDFLAVLAGKFNINVLVTEGFLCLVAILAVIFVVKSRKLFLNSDEHINQ